ncbi:hypothetical protein IG631_09538 [Alternaria alternata]|nr:hypothetical protein IG631_09538 [Alternaria alternata]
MSKTELNGHVCPSRMGLYSCAGAQCWNARSTVDGCFEGAVGDAGLPMSLTKQQRCCGRAASLVPTLLYKLVGATSRHCCSALLCSSDTPAWITSVTPSSQRDVATVPPSG